MKAARNVISVLLVVLNQQDLQSAARSPASVPSFDVLEHDRPDFRYVKLQNPNITAIYPQPYLNPRQRNTSKRGQKHVDLAT
jgi:hypothetical protein